MLESYISFQYLNRSNNMFPKFLVYRYFKQPIRRIYKRNSRLFLWLKKCNTKPKTKW